MAAMTVEQLKDVPPGATEHRDGHVSFSLWAPDKRSVHLIADFNGWNRATDPMRKDDKDVWAIAKKLKPGRYRYQFLVDGHLVICDPYAQAIERPAGDQVPQAVLELHERHVTEAIAYRKQMLDVLVDFVKTRRLG